MEYRTIENSFDSSVSLKFFELLKKEKYKRLRCYFESLEPKDIEDFKKKDIEENIMICDKILFKIFFRELIQNLN